MPTRRTLVLSGVLTTIIAAMLPLKVVAGSDGLLDVALSTAVLRKAMAMGAVATMAEATEMAVVAATAARAPAGVVTGTAATTAGVPATTEMVPAAAIAAATAAQPDPIRKRALQADLARIRGPGRLPEVGLQIPAVRPAPPRLPPGPQRRHRLPRPARKSMSVAPR